MRIDLLQYSEETDLHIWSRHHVTIREVEDVVYQYGFVIRGRAEGLYVVYGRTDAGRYLTIATRYLGKGVALLITAREMNWAERRRYELRMAH